MKKHLLFLSWVSAFVFNAADVVAQAKTSKPGGGVTQPMLQSWMSPELTDAWNSGFKGQGVKITVVDDFSSGSRLWGNLGGGNARLRHGEWTYQEASMIAPLASMGKHDFNSGRTVPLAQGLNVLNLSYGMYAKGGYSAGQIGWSPQENSIINYANGGKAVIAKAAGNDAVPIGGVNASGNVDYLNLALKSSLSAIYVGALSKNGTPSSPASLASYSNTAGADGVVQGRFLVVGVEGNKTGLHGTSFAAPIVSGYAAVVGSKFTSATPTQVSNRLLSTARGDTVLGYNPQLHGKGEASITRALAPVSIQ